MPADKLVWILPADVAGTRYGCATIGEVRYPQSDRAAVSALHHLCHAYPFRECQALGDTSFVNLNSTAGFTSRPGPSQFHMMSSGAQTWRVSDGSRQILTLQQPYSKVALRAAIAEGAGAAIRVGAKTTGG
jgi:hypothetical protein